MKVGNFRPGDWLILRLLLLLVWHRKSPRYCLLHWPTMRMRDRMRKFAVKIWWHSFLIFFHPSFCCQGLFNDASVWNVWQDRVFYQRLVQLGRPPHMFRHVRFGHGCNHTTCSACGLTGGEEHCFFPCQRFLKALQSLQVTNWRSECC